MDSQRYTSMLLCPLGKFILGLHNFFKYPSKKFLLYVTMCPNKRGLHVTLKVFFLYYYPGH